MPFLYSCCIYDHAIRNYNATFITYNTVTTTQHGATIAFVHGSILLLYQHKLYRYYTYTKGDCNNIWALQDPGPSRVWHLRQVGWRSDAQYDPLHEDADENQAACTLFSGWSLGMEDRSWKQAFCKDLRLVMTNMIICNNHEDKLMLSIMSMLLWKSHDYGKLQIELK